MAREMKDSGIEWIGEIPCEWHLEKHKYLFSCGKEIVGKASVSTQLLSLTTQGVKLKNSDAVGGKLPESFDTYQTVEKGNLIMCLFDLDCSAVFSGLSPFSGMISPAYKVLKCSEKIIPAFADYWFRFVFDGRKFKSYAKNLRYTLNYDEFACIPLALPSLQEQQRIAAFLDCKCAEIDSVIAATQRTIEEYKVLKQSIITDAVTKGVRGKRPMKDSGIELVDVIPEEWRYSPIKYVAKFQPACNTSDFTEDTEITYTPMDCIKNGYYVQNTAKYGSVASSLTPYEEGDIVMAKVTPCFENGNIALMENLASGFGMGSSELFVYRAIDVNVRFLLYWLQNDKFKDGACATMTGTGGLKRVSPYYAKNAMILLPSDDEQEEIVAYLDAKCADMDSLIASKEKLLTELESYKKSVIYEYVTGKKEVPACQ